MKIFFWIAFFLLYREQTWHAECSERFFSRTMVSPWQRYLLRLIPQVFWVDHCLFLHYLKLEEILLIVIDRFWRIWNLPNLGCKLFLVWYERVYVGHTQLAMKYRRPFIQFTTRLDIGFLRHKLRSWLVSSFFNWRTHRNLSGAHDRPWLFDSIKLHQQLASICWVWIRFNLHF